MFRQPTPGLPFTTNVPSMISVVIPVTLGELRCMDIDELANEKILAHSGEVDIDTYSICGYMDGTKEEPAGFVLIYVQGKKKIVDEWLD